MCSLPYSFFELSNPSDLKLIKISKNKMTKEWIWRIITYFCTVPPFHQLHMLHVTNGHFNNFRFFNSTSTLEMKKIKFCETKIFSKFQTQRMKPFWDKPEELICSNSLGNYSFDPDDVFQWSCGTLGPESTKFQKNFNTWNKIKLNLNSK